MHFRYPQKLGDMPKLNARWSMGVWLGKSNHHFWCAQVSLQSATRCTKRVSFERQTVAALKTLMLYAMPSRWPIMRATTLSCIEALTVGLWHCVARGRSRRPQHSFSSYSRILYLGNKSVAHV